MKTLTRSRPFNPDDIQTHWYVYVDDPPIDQKKEVMKNEFVIKVRKYHGMAVPYSSYCLWHSKYVKEAMV